MNGGLIGLPGWGTLTQRGRPFRALPPFVARESGSFTAPQDGWYLVEAVGGGGSGGAARISSGRATGGAGGGLAAKLVYLRAGSTVDFTVGAGGAQVVVSTNSTTTAGNAGGTTTVSGPGFSLNVPGGSGGGADSGAGTTSGATCSKPTGGDINIAGGSSGDVVIASTTRYGATGGGAVQIFGQSTVSGDAIPAASLDIVATGGAGIAESSDDSTVDETPTAGGRATLGAAINSSNLSADFAGAILSMGSPLLMVALANGDQYPGQGSDGDTATSTSPGTSVNAGIFAGTGGVCSNASGTMTVASAEWGGGSGAGVNASTGTITINQGGDGGVVITLVG